jgi:hypothetical protein
VARALQRVQDEAPLDRHPLAARVQPLVDPHLAQASGKRKPVATDPYCGCLR